MIEKALQFTGKALNQFAKKKYGLEEDVVIINPIIDRMQKVIDSLSWITFS